MRVLQLANSAPRRSPFVIKTPQRLNGEGETPVRMEIDVVDQGILCSSP